MASHSKEYQHPLVIRFTHWVNFAALTIMVGSGLKIYNASPLWDFEIPQVLTLGGWLAGARMWHFFGMWLFFLNGGIWIVYNLASTHGRRTTIFRGADVPGVLPMIRYYLRIRKSHPPSGKYNALQKLAYSTVPLIAVGAILTGLSLYWPVQLRWITSLFGGYDTARVWHFVVAAAFVSFFAGHILMVVIAGWRNFFSMITGWKRIEGGKTSPPGSRKQRVMILGGGFGGLYAALELEKAFAKSPDVEITLVNKDNFFLFTPMLHEVAASDLDITHIVNPVRMLLQRVRFFHGEIESIDLKGKSVRVSHGSRHHHHDIPYDHLLIALGAVTNFHKLPGEKDAITMKSLGDAIHLRNQLIDNLEAADFDCFPEDREPLLTVVVAGGGFAGVETVASVHDFMREASRFYPNLNERMLRVVLVHSGPEILPELGPKLGAYARKKLAGRNVEIRTNTRVSSFRDWTAELQDGTKIRTSMLVWTAGTSPNPLLDGLPCARDRGRIVVDEFLEVPGFPGVWALGDCACVPDASTGAHCPPTAQHAFREGIVAGNNIIAAIRGGTKRPFRFRTFGALASIGRRTGVARLLGVNFSGFIAWWMWRTIYLSKLPRFEKKLRVALDWTLDLLFSKNLVQFETLRAKAISRGHEEVSDSPSDGSP